MPMDVDYRWRAEIDDRTLEDLHAAAFMREPADHSWSRQLEHSLGWMTATANGQLVGFVNVAWDGGAHAFILDTVVTPELQREGIGLALVHHAADQAKRAGCHWLHVDFEPDLEGFYLDACGFSATSAGLIRLRG